MPNATCRILLASSLALALAIPAPSQGGAGVPGCYFSHRGSVIGGHLAVDYGFPGLGTGIGVLSFSDGYGPVQHPLFGQIWFDTNSPNYNIVVQLPDATGNVHLEVDIPFEPALVLAPPIYVNGFMADGMNLPPPHWSLSKTVSFSFETQDGYRPLPDMLEPRTLHTATSLAVSPADDDVRVLIAGGGTGTMFYPVATATTELYSPLKRLFEAGPALSMPRMKHQAVRLQDGRVLICGGLTSGAIATATCEIFDPATDAFTPTGSMNELRMGHEATLLQDGRVLVTGGMPSWVNAGVELVSRLLAIHASAEIFEPSTGLWTAVNPMSVRRLGHSHTLLPDGRVVVIGGVNGGFLINSWGTTPTTPQVPTTTPVVEAFDPATNAFQVLPLALNSGLLGRAFHGCGLMADGKILVSGGIFGGAGNSGASPTYSVLRYDPGTGVLYASPQLVVNGLWLHRQVMSRWNGDAIIIGGFTDAQGLLDSVPFAWRHTGTNILATLPCGEHAVIPGGAAFPIAGFAMVPLYNDFTYLLCGGWSGSGTASTSSRAFLVSEQ